MNRTPPLRTAARRLAALSAVIALLGGGVVGCGGGGASKYEDFETLDLREKLVELPLGMYSVPVPVISSAGDGGLTRNNRVQMKFELTGLVKPEALTEATRLVERRQGQLRDGVIRVCRNASLDDLLDPQLSTVRSRILDEVQPLLDSVALRRVLVTRRMTEPL